MVYKPWDSWVPHFGVPKLGPPKATEIQRKIRTEDPPEEPAADLLWNFADQKGGRSSCT